MHVRRVVEDEWRELRETRLRALLDSPDAFGSTHEQEAQEDEASWRGWFTGWQPGWRQAVFAAVVDDGRWTGMALGALAPDAGGVARLFAMWVEPESRRRGAGGALVLAVTDWAREQGADAVLLGVTESNREAVQFYERCGFVGTADAPDPLRPGSSLMTAKMRLHLTQVSDDELIANQIRYYDDRAPSYEDLYFRRGVFERSPEFMERWRAMTGELEAAARAVASPGDVLELACGSGLWTRWFVPVARRLVAVDSSRAMIERNRDAIDDDRVEYVLADVFEWTTSDRFDLIVLGFFLSHIPPAKFDEFWSALREWLKPDGSVWFCDDAWGPFRPMSGRRMIGGPAHAHHRELEGRDYVISKIFWKPEDLAEQLRQIGWRAEIHAIDEHFLHGTAQPVT